MIILKNLRSGRFLIVAFMAFTVFAAAAAIACSSNKESYPATASRADASPLAIGSSSGDLGAFLTGPDGRTLYVFTKDAPNKSNCDANCVGTWPPLLVTQGQSIKPDASATGTFGTTSTLSGLQVTYNGAPLYHFAGDARPGDTKGNLVAGVWFVARPDTASAALVGVRGSRDKGSLVGPTGLSLYVFAKDAAGKSNCSGQCIESWPPLIVQPDVHATAVDQASGAVGVFARVDDGRQQLTYNGRPLYYFSGDKLPGDTTGDGVGGVWSLAKA
jgi:predicted lipoprotein with Yx(FWY)xxD motif